MEIKINKSLLIFLLNFTKQINRSQNKQILVFLSITKKKHIAPIISFYKKQNKIISNLNYPIFMKNKSKSFPTQFCLSQFDIDFDLQFK